MNKSICISSTNSFSINALSEIVAQLARKYLRTLSWNFKTKSGRTGHGLGNQIPILIMVVFSSCPFFSEIFPFLPFSGRITITPVQTAF